MEDNLPILCIDFDDVIARSTPIVESYLEKIEPRSSKKYHETLASLFNNCEIDDETYSLRTAEYYDLKDRVLEEVDDKFKGLIDYNCVINEKTVYKHAIDYVNFLCRCGHYKKCYILTHCNTESEINVKKKFVERYMPNIELIAVPFHKEKYQQGKKRAMTSKAEFFMEKMQLSTLYNVTLIDDNKKNGEMWKKNGGIYIKFDERVCNNVYSQSLSNLFPYDVISISDDGIMKIGRGK